MNLPGSDFREILQKEDLSFIEKWGRIQKLFSQVFGINSYLFGPAGNLQVPTSKATPFCCELSVMCDDPSPMPYDCVFKARESFASSEIAEYYDCVHRAHYHVVRSDKLHPFMLILGPVFVGKRPDESETALICKENNLNIDLFDDAIRNLKTLSHQRMRDISDFCLELLKDIS